MKRVLLTGIGGSVGIFVAIHIMSNTDWEVVGLDSFHHKGYRDRLNEVYKDHPEWKPRIKVFQHELSCSISKKLKEEIGDVDYILHLAAMSDVDFSIENPVFTIKNNIESTLTMLEYARKTDHEAFIYFSTDEVYGPVKKGKAHKEWDTHRPSNPYSASKAASEDICYAYWRAGYVKLIITNTMNNFAEMQSHAKFPVKIQRAVDKGDTVTIHGNEKEIGTRFYIHSRNVADALLFILNKPVYLHKGGELDEPDRYHIVGERAVSNLELAQLIADIMGKPLKYELVDFHKHQPAHDIHYGLQDNKLRVAGWEQPMTLEETLRTVVTWQSEHKEWLEHE